MGHQPNGTFTMDRYTVTPYEGLASITIFPPSIDPNLQFLGRHYALAQANFQPEIAPTTPNVLAALAGTSDGWYSNNDPPASDTFRTIFDQLQAAGHSWDIFYGVPPALLKGTVWDRLMPAGHTGQLVDTASFITEAAEGTLPDFSFVRPGYGYSEESPEDTSLGDAWLGQLVLAVMKGPDWPSTAIFVTYDEGGGFWDHVSPPQVDPAGYGTRTPMVVISPYTPAGLISETTTNLSVLSFMQALWHLPALDATNALRPEPVELLRFRPAPASAPTAPGSAAGHPEYGGGRTRFGPVYGPAGRNRHRRPGRRDARPGPGRRSQRRREVIDNRPGRSGGRQGAGGRRVAPRHGLVQCALTH